MTSPLPRLTIYTEGDLTRGLGHITRCQAYAQGWRRRGGAVDWVVDGDESARRVLTSEANVAMKAWQTSAAPARNGLALIDSYSAPRSTYVALAPSGGVFLDDLVRLDYPSGLAAHSAPGVIATRGTAHWLMGPAWHPLRPAFQALSGSKQLHRARRVLVVLGGVDHRGLGAELAALMRASLPEFDVDLVLGAETPDPAPVAGVRWHRSLPAEAMRDLMRRAEFAVSAAGQTLYELACCGCPALLIGVAENQANHLAVWPTTGAGLTMGWWDDPGLQEALVHHARALAQDPEIRKRMSDAGRRLVDGQGVDRLWDYVLDHGC